MSACQKIDDLIKWLKTFDESKCDNQTLHVDTDGKEIESKSDDDNINWQCSNCTFINTVCLYECELCDGSNAAKQQIRDIDWKKEEIGPMSNSEILREYLLNAEKINNKFVNAFGRTETTVSLAKYTISNSTKVDIVVQLIERERSKFKGIIFKNNDDVSIDLLADIVSKIRDLYNDLWIGVEFNFKYLSNNVKRIEKNKMAQNRQIINNLSGMGFSIKCDEFIFQFINDYNLTDVINGIFIKDSGIRVNHKNIACLRCIQKGAFEKKHNKNNLIYFGGINIGFKHSNADCKQLGEILGGGYMDCVCLIINQVNIAEVANKLKILKKEINGNCKIGVVGMKQQIEWLTRNHGLNQQVDVVIYCF